jgi:hypothetical protein
MKKRRVWVVEMLCPYTDDWTATVGSALDRYEARKRMAEWKRRNPNDRFRVMPYDPVPGGATRRGVPR